MAQVGILDEKKYGQLIGKHRPRVIKSDADLERMAAYLEELDRKEETTPLTQEEQTLQELLDHLCMDYNQRTTPIPENVPPLEMLKYLMEAGNLKQADLLDAFASRAVASQVLTGQRAISKTHARRLAQRFNLSADLFI